MQHMKSCQHLCPLYNTNANFDVAGMRKADWLAKPYINLLLQQMLPRKARRFLLLMVIYTLPYLQPDAVVLLSFHNELGAQGIQNVSFSIDTLLVLPRDLPPSMLLIPFIYGLDNLAKCLN